MNHSTQQDKPSGEKATIILIDNFDSFTYNLVAQFRQLGYPVSIFRNEVTIEQLEEQVHAHSNVLLALSPGPGCPSNAGNLIHIIQHFLGRLPILGICLGHQALVESQGGKVIQAHEVVHGKSTNIELVDHPIFTGLPRPFRVARYHSLVVENIPPQFQVLAKFGDEVMAVLETNKMAVGFQFHPESILTTLGDKLVSQTITWLMSNFDQEATC